ncbi:unnamed protein product [Cuscuta epithymum]|uniref:Uncharacterized protein n=1 Tax=Cuscuta epithymum TaxID=186058 RepID=A0AAV0G5M1_9ASTE|nr:unnamed protein product [Cuscuta epithymum]CAH9142530.1 unnamed protein product [Cuscuta epithymum]
MRNPRYERTRRKMDLLVFNGSEAYDWIIKVERFYPLNQVAAEKKVELVVIAMEEREDSATCQSGNSSAKNLAPAKRQITLLHLKDIMEDRVSSLEQKLEEQSLVLGEILQMMKDKKKQKPKSPEEFIRHEIFIF